MSATNYSWPELQATDTYQSLETPEEQLTMLRGWADAHYASYDGDKSPQEVQNFDVLVSFLAEDINAKAHNPEGLSISKQGIVDRQIDINKSRAFQAENVRSTDRLLTDILRGTATLNEETGKYQKYGKDRDTVEFSVGEGHLNWLKEQEKSPLGRLNWVTRRTLELEPHEDSLDGVEVNYAAAALGKDHFEALIDNEEGLSDSEKFRVKQRYNTYKRLAYADFQDYITSKKVADRPLGTRSIFAKDSEDDQDMDVESFRMFLTEDRLSEYKDNGREFDTDRVTDEILQLWATKRGLGDYADYITLNKEESSNARDSLSGMFSDALTNHPATWSDSEVMRKESDGGLLLNPRWLAEGISDDDVRERIENSGEDVPEDVLEGFLHQLDINRESKARSVLSNVDSLAGGFIPWDARAKDLSLFKRANSDKGWDDQTMVSEYLKNTKDPENFWKQIGYGVPTLDNIGAFLQTWSSEDSGWFGDAAYGLGNFLRGLQAGAVQDVGMTASSVIGSATTALGADTGDFLESIKKTQEAVSAVDSIHGKAPRFGRMFGQELALLGLTAGVGKAGNALRARQAQKALIDVTNRKAIQKNLEEFASDITVGDVDAPALNPAGKFKEFTDKLAGKTYFGLQASRSGGAMYMDAFTKIKNELIQDAGMDPDEAEEIARTNAILPGIGGALITYSLMKAVPGDVMGGIFNRGSNISTASMMKRFKMDRKSWRRAMDDPELKEEVAELLGDSFSLNKFLNLRSVRAGGREAAEEFLDEIGQGILSMATYNPELSWAETVSHATEAAFVGGVLGGLAGGLSQRPPIVEEQLAPEMQVKLQELDLKFNRLIEEGNTETAEAIRQVSESVRRDGPKVPIVSEPDPDEEAPVELGVEGEYFHTPGKFTRNDRSEGRGLLLTLESGQFIVPNIEDEFEKGGTTNYPDLSSATTPGDVVNILGDEKYTPIPLSNIYGFVEDNVGTAAQMDKFRVLGSLTDEIVKIGERSGDIEELSKAYENVINKARKTFGSDRESLGIFYNRASDNVKSNFKGLFVGTVLDDVEGTISEYHSTGPEAFPGVITDESARELRDAATFKSRGWLQSRVKSLSDTYKGQDRGIGEGQADSREVSEVFGVALDLAFSGVQVMTDYRKGDRNFLVKVKKEVDKFRKDFKTQYGLWDKNQMDTGFSGNALKAVKTFYNRVGSLLSESFPSDSSVEARWGELTKNVNPAYKRLMSYAKHTSEGVTLPTLLLPSEKMGLLNDVRISSQDKNLIVLNNTTNNSDTSSQKAFKPLLHRVYRDRLRDNRFSWDEGSDVPFIPNESALKFTLKDIWEGLTTPKEGEEPTPVTKEQFAELVANDADIARYLPEDPETADATRAALLHLFWMEREQTGDSAAPADSGDSTLILEDMVEKDLEIEVKKFSKDTEELEKELSQSAGNMFYNAVYNRPESGNLTLKEFTSRVIKHDPTIATGIKSPGKRVEFVATLTQTYKDGVNNTIAELVNRAELIDVDTRVEVEARLKNRIPRTEDLMSQDVMSILGWREGDRTKAKEIGDIVDLYNVDKPNEPRVAKLVDKSSGEPPKISGKDFWVQNDIGHVWVYPTTEKDTATMAPFEEGVKVFKSAKTHKGNYFSSKDRQLVVESVDKGLWVAGIWSPDPNPSSKVTDEGHIFKSVVDEVSGSVFFKSAKIAKEAALSALADRQRPDQAIKVFQLQEGGEFRQGGEIVSIQVGSSADNVDTGWSETPWDDQTNNEKYKLSMDYGVGDNRIYKDTSIRQLKAKDLENLSGLISNFLKGSKDKQANIRAKLDARAVKAARQELGERDLSSLITPVRRDLKSKSRSLNPGAARKAAFEFLTLSKEVQGTYESPEKYIKTRLADPKFTPALKKSARVPDQVSESAFNETSEFAKNLTDGVLQNEERLRFYLNKFVATGQTPSIEDIKEDNPDNYAALMLGAYEMLFDVEGVNENVVVPQMLRLVKEDENSTKIVGGILGRVEDYLRETSSTDARGFVPKPADTELPDKVVRRVKAYYDKRVTSEAKERIKTQLYKHVGNAVANRVLAYNSPELAIERMSELLSMARPDGAELLKRERRRGFKSVAPNTKPAVSEKDYVKLELLRANQDATVTVKLLDEAYNTAVNRIDAAANSAWDRVNEVIDRKTKIFTDVSPEKITWRRSDTSGVYIGTSSTFNEYRNELAKNFTEDFFNQIRGVVITSQGGLVYSQDANDSAKREVMLEGTRIEDKRKIGKLINLLKLNPEISLRSVVGGDSKFAKAVRARLKGYQTSFKNLAESEFEGSQLWPGEKYKFRGGSKRGTKYELYREAKLVGDTKSRPDEVYVGSISLKELNTREDEVGKLEEDIEGRLSHKKELLAENEVLLQRSKASIKEYELPEGLQDGRLKKGSIDIPALKSLLIAKKKPITGSRSDLIYRLEGGEDLVNEINQIDEGLKIVEDTKAKLIAFVDNKIGEGLEGAKQRAASLAAESASRLLKGALFHQDEYINAFEALDKSINDSLTSLSEATRPNEEVAAAWKSTIIAIREDLGRRIVRAGEYAEVGERAQSARDNITALTTYKTTLANAKSLATTPKTPPSGDVGVLYGEVAPTERGYFHSSQQLDTNAHIKFLAGKVEQVPLTPYDATFKPGKEGTKRPRDLTKRVADLNKGKDKLLKPFRAPSFIVKLKGGGTSFANRLTARSPAPVEGYREGDKLDYNAFIKKVNKDFESGREFYGANNYFHVVDKNGKYRFTNNPLHVASYFSTSTTDSKGVTTYPQKFKLDKKFKEDLHPGIILDKEGYVIGAATHFRPPGTKPDWIGPRANFASYVKAHTGTDKNGNSIGGRTLHDISADLTPFELRSNRQTRTGTVSKATEEVTLALDALNRVILSPEDFLPHEVEFLYDALRIAKNRDAKPILNFTDPKKIKKRLSEEVRAEKYHLKPDTHTLSTLLDEAYNHYTREDKDGEIVDEDIRNAASGKENINWHDRFKVHVVMSLLKTRILAEDSKIREDSPQKSRSIIQRIKADPEDAFSYLSADGLQHMGSLTDDNSGNVIHGKAWGHVFGNSEYTRALLGISAIEARRDASRGNALQYLTDDASPIKVFKSAEYLRAAKEATEKASHANLKSVLLSVISAQTRNEKVLEFNPNTEGDSDASAVDESVDTVSIDELSPEEREQYLNRTDSTENFNSIRATIFGTRTPFDGLTEKTREELASRVFQELSYLGIKDGEPDSLRVALLKIKEGVSEGLFPAHYSELADILLKSGKLDFDNLTLVVTDSIEQAGFYNPKTNTVVLNSSATNPRGVQDVVIHELFHVAFEKVLSDPQTTNHKLVVDALDALIDRGRAFYETGEINRLGAQKRAEFQAEREANNYSLDIIKGLVDESNSLFKSELSESPTPSEYRGVYRNIRAEELGANKYFDDVIQIRHALGMREDGSYSDPEVARSEFFTHLVTDDTTQWYMKEIDRVSPRGSLWDGTIRVITRGISGGSDESDFADELVSAFLTLTGNERYRDWGAEKTLREIIGHTKQDLNNANSYRESAPAFSPDFDLSNLNHSLGSEASKILDALGPESPAKNIISALNIAVATGGNINRPDASALTGVINLPESGVRERRVVSAALTSAYESAYTPGEREAALVGYLESASTASDFLAQSVKSAGSWENFIGEITADAFYGDVKSDFESSLQTLRARVLSRDFGLTTARHVEELLEVLGRVVPEKRSFIRENYLSSDSNQQFDGVGFVGDKIIAERAVDKHNLSIAPDDYVSIKEEIKQSDLNFKDYVDKHIEDEDTREQLMVVEGEMLLQLEEYNKNSDPDERGVVGLQRVISGLPHDVTTEDILASKKSESFEEGESPEEGKGRVRRLADEISARGKKALKPEFVSKIWGTLKGLKNPFSAELDPTTGLQDKPPIDEHKKLLGAASFGSSLRLDGFFRALTVRGKGGKPLHEESKRLRGGINKTVTKAQLLTSAINKQMREQFGVSSLGEMAESWDNAELAERWGLPAGVNAGSHLATLINRTLGEKDDKVLVDEFGPSEPPPNFEGAIWSELPNIPGMSLRERVIRWRDTKVQSLRSKISGARKGIRDAWEADPSKNRETVDAMRALRADKNREENTIRNIAGTALTALYVESAGNFRTLQESAVKEIIKLDEANLAAQGKAGAVMTSANSLSGALLELRGAINSFQNKITASPILSQTFKEVSASSGPDSVVARLYAADSMFSSMQAKISASNNIHLTTTYQLNDEKKNYMRWLGSQEPEARRRFELAKSHFKDIRLRDKARKLAKESDISVEEATRLLKMENEPIPHNELIDDIRRFIQGFGSAGVEGSALGLMNVKTLIPKKEIATPLQEAAGAYKDNIFNAARTLTTLGTLEANHEYLTSVKEMLERIQKEANETKGPNEPNIVLLSEESGHRQHGLVKFSAPEGAGSTSGNFGPLEGLYGPPLLVKALQEVSRKNYAGVQKHLMWLSSQTMANVTTRRPRTHVRNFVGNPMFLVNAGMPLHAIKGFRILTDWIHGGEGAGSAVMKAAMVGARDQIEALPNSSKLSKAFKGALSLFVANDSSRFLGKTSIFEPELMAIMEEYAEFLVTGQDVRSNVIQEARKSVMNTGGGDPIFGLSMVPSSKARGFKKQFDSIDKVLESMYGAEDDYWKASAYEGQLTKLANVFDISDIDSEERYAPFTLRKRIGQMLNGKYDGAMTAEQANRILETFKPRTEEQRTDRAKLLKDDRRSAALYTLKAEAAYRVQETMPNYSMTVELVKWMKRNQLTAYVAPFISFYAETLRLSVKTPILAAQEIRLGYKTNNMKLMQMGANRAAWSGATLFAGSKAMQGLWSLLGALMGAGDDEDKDLTAEVLGGDNVGDTDDVKALKRFLHEWYQKGTLAFFGDPEGGFPIMMDVSHMMPLASGMDSIRRYLEARTGGREVAGGLIAPEEEFLSDMFGQFFQPQMWAQAITGGRYQPNDSLSEFESTILDPAKAILSEAHKIALPGYVTDAIKLASAFKNRGKIIRGQKVSVGDEFLSAVFGVNIKRIDIRDEFKRKLSFRNKQLRDAKRDLNRLMRGRSTVTEDEVLESVERYKELYRGITLRLIRDYKAAQHFIGDDADIIMDKQLDKQVLSQVYGEYAELAPLSGPTIDDAYRISEEIANPERLAGIDALYETPVEFFDPGEIMKVISK